MSWWAWVGLALWAAVSYAIACVAMGVWSYKEEMRGGYGHLHFVRMLLGWGLVFAFWPIVVPPFLVAAWMRQDGKW